MEIRDSMSLGVGFQSAEPDVISDVKLAECPSDGDRVVKVVTRGSEPVVDVGGSLVALIDERSGVLGVGPVDVLDGGYGRVAEVPAVRLGCVERLEVALGKHLVTSDGDTVDSWGVWICPHVQIGHDSVRLGRRDARDVVELGSGFKHRRGCPFHGQAGDGKLLPSFLLVVENRGASVAGEGSRRGVLLEPLENHRGLLGGVDLGQHY